LQEEVAKLELLVQAQQDKLVGRQPPDASLWRKCMLFQYTNHVLMM